jgi:hypothetical protein
LFAPCDEHPSAPISSAATTPIFIGQPPGAQMPPAMHWYVLPYALWHWGMVVQWLHAPSWQRPFAPPVSVQVVPVQPLLPESGPASPAPDPPAPEEPEEPEAPDVLPLPLCAPLPCVELPVVAPAEAPEAPDAPVDAPVVCVEPLVAAPEEAPVEAAAPDVPPEDAAPDDVLLPVPAPLPEPTAVPEVEPLVAPLVEPEPLALLPELPTATQTSE